MRRALLPEATIAALQDRAATAGCTACRVITDTRGEAIIAIDGQCFDSIEAATAYVTRCEQQSSEQRFDAAGSARVAEREAQAVLAYSPY